MTDGPALLAAILDAPVCDTARLVFADWLQENGQVERAEFIRAQISFARTPETYAYNTALREHALLARHAYDWTDPIMRGRSHMVDGTSVRMPFDGAIEFEAIFFRGFVARLACSIDDFLEHGAAILAAHPIEEIRFPQFRVEIESPGKDHGWRIYCYDVDPPPGYFSFFSGGIKSRAEMIERLLRRCPLLTGRVRVGAHGQVPGAGGMLGIWPADDRNC